MDLNIKIDGKNITEDVSVNSCAIDLSINSFRDNCTVVFNDSQILWSSWGLINGTSLEILNGKSSLFSGFVTTTISSSGFFSVEGISGSDRIDAPVSYSTLESTPLRSILSSLSSSANLTPKFSGSFDFQIPSGFWLPRACPTSHIKFLSNLFDFFFVVSGSSIFFSSNSYIKNQSPNGIITIRDDDLYSFSQNRKPRKIRVLGAESGEEAELEGGAGEEIVLLEGSWGKAGIKEVAERIAERENRNRAFELTREIEGQIIAPGSVVEVEAPSESESGRYLVTGVRVYVEKNTQKIQGVKLT